MSRDFPAIPCGRNLRHGERNILFFGRPLAKRTHIFYRTGQVRRGQATLWTVSHYDRRSWFRSTSRWPGRSTTGWLSHPTTGRARMWLRTFDTYYEKNVFWCNPGAMSKHRRAWWYDTTYRISLRMDTIECNAPTR